MHSLNAIVSLCAVGDQQSHCPKPPAADMSPYYLTTEPRSETKRGRSPVGPWSWPPVCAPNRARCSFSLYMILAGACHLYMVGPKTGLSIRKFLTPVYDDMTLIISYCSVL